jgi:hypothetical protein
MVPHGPQVRLKIPASGFYEVARGILKKEEDATNAPDMH